MMKPLPSQSHRRHDPLRDEWVLVSPGRSLRPWSGAVEIGPAQVVPEYDPGCFLCPGNQRASGERNPTYDAPFVFTNDFAALSPDADTEPWSDGLLIAQGEAGTCRVVCFSPRHDLSLGAMPVADVRRVIDTWAEQTTQLGERYAHVQVFENRGPAMGASSPHPHGQIWAGTALPVALERERMTQAAHFASTGKNLLVTYEQQERSSERLIVANDAWSAVVPFWASWPFETLVLPRTPVARLAELEPIQRDLLAPTLVTLAVAYDRLFGVPFPYSMGWHQAPFDGRPTDGWQLHAHFYPPLLRSATVRKFMVGYELLAEPQRDLTPEDAAERLRGAL